MEYALGLRNKIDCIQPHGPVNCRLAMALAEVRNHVIKWLPVRPNMCTRSLVKKTSLSPHEVITPENSDQFLKRELAARYVRWIRVAVTMCTSHLVYMSFERGT